MRHFQIRRGEPQDVTTVAAQTIERIEPDKCAILGRDFPGLRPRFLVEEGDDVATGQPIFTDRKHPEISYVSPISGTVSTIAYGPRRTLSICVVTAKKTGATIEAPGTLDTPEKLRQVLQSRGLWPAFRTRPFGCVPAPGSLPQAIFVNAVRASPAYPDPQKVLADQQDYFQRGTLLLAQLTDGPVFLCQSPGEPLGPRGERIVHASFEGSKVAGLAGTQIEKLCPVDRHRMVWSIGYQDVAAIGHLVETGVFKADRVVSVTHHANAKAHTIRTCLGARASDLGETSAWMANACGHETLYLGRFDDLVHFAPTTRMAESPSWRDRLFFKQNALIPTEAISKSLPSDLLTIPLLRALSVGDSETAERLGCLALIEEDLIAASRRCTSGADYGALLRSVLDDLRAEMS